MSTLTTVSSYGPSGSSARVRVLDWVRHLSLNTENHDYLGTGSLGPGVLRRSGPSAIARAEQELRRLTRQRPRRLLLSREASPFSRGGIEERLLRSAEFSVYDLDDGLAWDERPVRDPAHWFPKREKAIRAAAAADIVMVGSPTLFDWATQVGSHAVYVPSCVEPAAYIPLACYELHDPPRLVWMGSPSTEHLLLPVSDALLEVHRSTGARLRLISAGAAPLGRLDTMVDRLPWSAETFARDLSESDVAVAPMSDSIYNRAKCAYKVLQYGATALPTVVSPVGANGVAAELLGSRRAIADDDWVQSLAELLALSARERRTLGEAAKAGVDMHYSYAAWSTTWCQTLGIRR